MLTKASGRRRHGLKAQPVRSSNGNALEQTIREKTVRVVRQTHVTCFEWKSYGITDAVISMRVVPRTAPERKQIKCRLSVPEYNLVYIPVFLCKILREEERF